MMNSDGTNFTSNLFVSAVAEPDKRGPYYHFFYHGWKGIGFGICIASDAPDNEYEKRETYISASFLFWGLIVGVRT